MTTQKDKIEARKAALARRDHWNELFEMRDRQREQMRDGIAVIKRADLPVEVNRQGVMRWYMHPSITDTVLSTLMFFEQEIPPRSRSGRIRFQGGQVMMILEGEGYTMVDGVRHNWKAGDVVNLPLRTRGVIVQHFNAHPTAKVRFVATEPNWFACTSVDRGSGFEQLEEAPEYGR